MEAIVWIVGGSLAVTLLVGSLLFCCLCVTCKQSRTASFRDRESGLDMEEDEEELLWFQGGEHLTIDEILNASGEVLGKSSYGTVYKARMLSDGSMIALRLLRDGCIKTPEEFIPALRQMGVIRQSHLVRLLGFYSGPRGERLLVTDFMPRGNLADFLHNSHRPSPGWARLHRIALGAARGLAYLHTGMQTPIIHGNLKSKNILIDENYEGHLTDFGLHEFLNAASQAAMLEASASQGYKAPELLKMKKASTKTDIYSFGIVLLEILTGRKPNARNSSNQIVDLPTVVKQAVVDETISDLFSPAIIGGGLKSPSEEGLFRALQLAMGCCAPSPSVRPDIQEVVRQLEKISPTTCSPTFIFSPQYTSEERSSREFAV